MSDETDQFWITGAYKTDEPVLDPWITFAYGPFPDQKSCEERATDEKVMFKALGSTTQDYEIDNMDRLSYGSACKHFEETIQSEHFEEWYNLATKTSP